jgi:hypothetical protein
MVEVGCPAGVVGDAGDACAGFAIPGCWPVAIPAAPHAMIADAATINMVVDFRFAVIRIFPPFWL